MSKVKVGFMIGCLVGITGLSALGASGAEISALVPIGIGLGTAISAVIAAVKRK